MCRRARAGVGGLPEISGDRQGGAEGVPKVGAAGATWGGGLERRVRLRGRQRAKSWARGTGRGGRSREGDGGVYFLGVLTRGDRKVREEGETGGSLKMGVGELWRAARGPGNWGSQESPASLRNPRGGTGVAPGLRLGGQGVSAELGEGGARPRSGPAVRVEGLVRGK